jgi:gliding motility-associated-like protein
MKKFILFTLAILLLAGQGYAQFSATLTGYPLVTTGWNIGASATVIDSTVQLTPPSGGQNGYVYYSTPVDLTACGQFTVDFEFKIVVSPASQVADGIAFWYISNPPSGFISGGGIGLPSNPNGLIMVMDTYDNAAPYNVPLETLLGYNGTIPGYTEGAATGVIAPVVGSQAFITDGTWHHCKIDYNSGSVNVYFNYSAAPSLTGIYPLAISGYFGFSSSTGAAFSTQSIKNVHISAAGTTTPPVVTSPVIYCQNDVATALTATGTPGNILKWFTTDTATVVSLLGAPVPNTSATGTTWYYVRQTPSAGNCISDPDSVEVIVNPHPAAPVITGINQYCQGATFVPFTVTGATGSLLWYTVPTGGTGSATAIPAYTSITGFQSIWVSQVVAGCEGPRDSIGVRIVTTPPPPGVSGNTDYCQFIGPYVPVTLSTTPTGTALWYTAATGGTSSTMQPTVDVNIYGSTTFYTSQVDSGCESNRASVTINVNPKPAPPTYVQPIYCQFTTAAPLAATGSNITWYGPGSTPGYTVTPTPATVVPGTDSFYATQTSIFGCVSDSAYMPVKITPQPAPPVTADLSYCRLSPAPALTAIGTDIKWFNIPVGGTELSPVPVPFTLTLGNTTWYASQTVDGCESNRSPLTVSILYKPDFRIAMIEKSFVCQFDSIVLSYSSADTFSLHYLWTIPGGATILDGGSDHSNSIHIEFDSVNQLNTVHLTATTLDGTCSTDTSLNVHVVELPTAQAYSRPNACQGDTTSLSLTYRSPTASIYKWTIDNINFGTNAAATIITASANSGGPYLVRWNDSGRHVIQLNTFTAEGCSSAPSYDTVDVHKSPDATFKFASKNGNLCLEDSVIFIANTADYANTYHWTPEHYFDNFNKPTAYGKVQEERSVIMLTVTDPFGCTANFTTEIDPSTCCKVFMPNAFTPGSANVNGFFHPVFAGYHRFHTFRVINRWGQIVFESADTDPKWDGTYNGVPQDVGTYYYYVKFDCGGKVIEQKGDITLVR